MFRLPQDSKYIMKTNTRNYPLPGQYTQPIQAASIIGGQCLYKEAQKAQCSIASAEYTTYSRHLCSENQTVKHSAADAVYTHHWHLHRVVQTAMCSAAATNFSQAQHVYRENGTFWHIVNVSMLWCQVLPTSLPLPIPTCVTSSQEAVERTWKLTVTEQCRKKLISQWCSDDLAWNILIVSRYRYIPMQYWTWLRFRGSRNWKISENIEQLWHYQYI